MLARAITSNLDANFLKVVSNAIIDIYIGESARLIREMFGYAHDHQPCIIFMHEIDAIGGCCFSEGTSVDREIPTTIHATRVSVLLGLLTLIMTRVVIIVDKLGRKFLPPGGVYGDHLVAYKVYILEDKDVFEKGVLMHAHFKSSFLYGIRMMQSHLCMVVIDCNTICFSTWAVISCLKLVSNAEVIVG